MYKDKERNSKTFLDVVGVKDRSNMVLLENPISQEKGILRRERMQRWRRLLNQYPKLAWRLIDLQARYIFKLHPLRLTIQLYKPKLSAFELVISKGGKVAEKTVKFDQVIDEPTAYWMELWPKEM